ncbi:C-4 methylsterol oxidase [Saitozyma sp. JCM 24511]|nr:C-4 methylsterol oxidase [Saitozyma sp. JCM 24511]
MSSTVSTAYAVAMNFLSKYAPVAAEQFAITNVTETQNALFGDVDLPNLNCLERAWASYYIHMGNAVLATGLMSFVLHEFVYFGRAIPWLVIDAMPYFQTWKLQHQNKHVTKEQIWNCTKVVLLTHFTCEGPLIWLFHPICCYFGMATYEVPFSPIWLMAAQIAFFFVFEDMFHYWAHRGLHYGPLYRHIHKVHHEFSAPIGLAAEYAHPLEVMILRGCITCLSGLRKFYGCMKAL